MNNSNRMLVVCFVKLLDRHNNCRMLVTQEIERFGRAI